MRFYSIIKIVISFFLIYWILRGVEFEEILNAIRTAKPNYLIAALLLNFVGYFLSARRWRLLLRTHGVYASTFYLVKSFMVGIFFNNLLPSIIGGDITRAYDTWRFGASKKTGLAVILVDRFLGLLALLLFAFSALVVSSELNERFPFLQLWILLICLGFFVTAYFIFMPPDKLVKSLEKTGGVIPQKIRKILEKFINAFLAFRGRKDTFLRALGLSLLLQTNVVIHYYLISKSLSFDVPFHIFFVIIPLAIFIMMIPVSINAIGIRENVFVFFFSIFFVSKPEAIAFAWLVYGLVILQGIMGGVVYAIRRSPQTPSDADFQTDSTEN